MEHQIYVYWPLFLWVLVFTIIPIAYAITNCICSWVDRGEESFKYPELTDISFYRGIASWDSFSNATPYLFLFSTLGTMVIMLLYVIDPNIAQYLMVVVLLLSVVVIVLRKVVDLAKALVAHTNDPKAHEKDSQ